MVTVEEYVDETVLPVVDESTLLTEKPRFENSANRSLWNCTAPGHGTGGSQSRSSCPRSLPDSYKFKLIVRSNDLSCKKKRGPAKKKGPWKKKNGCLTDKTVHLGRGHGAFDQNCMHIRFHTSSVCFYSRTSFRFPIQAIEWWFNSKSNLTISQPNL